MNNQLKINSKALLDTATEMKCPGCGSNLFFQTMEIKKISPLMTGTGQPAAASKLGPLLCVECHRQLKDDDFGYATDETKIIEQKQEQNPEQEDQEEKRYLED